MFRGSPQNRGYSAVFPWSAAHRAPYSSPGVSGYRSALALCLRSWVGREEGSATRAVAGAALADIGVHPRRRLVLPGWEMVKLAVARGAGVAALSRLAIDVELRAGTLVVLEVPRWHARRHLSVITARDVDLTPAATRFLDALASVVSDAGRVPATASPE